MCSYKADYLQFDIVVNNESISNYLLTKLTVIVDVINNCNCY